VAEKPRDSVVKFDTYRNLQRHRAVLPAIARLLSVSDSVLTSENAESAIDNNRPNSYLDNIEIPTANLEFTLRPRRSRNSVGV